MYSVDFRKACIWVYEKLGSYRKVADLVGASASSICRWAKYTFDKRSRKLRTSICSNPLIVDAINLFMESYPFSSCIDVQRAILKTVGINISYELARLAVVKAGFTRKRPRFYSSPHHLEQSTNVFNTEKEMHLGKRFVYVDETGFSSNVRPTIGYSKKGKRLHIRYKPSSQDKKHITAVTLADSETNKVTFTLLQGHCDTSKFVTFLQQYQFPPNTVFVMDNVSFHHSRLVKNVFDDRKWI